jgi:nucleoside-diphosphate-sugar epimerase
MVYGRPVNLPIAEDDATSPTIPYGASKLSAEHVVMAARASYGLSVIIGRAFVVYGPGEDVNSEAEVSVYIRALLSGSGIRVVGDPDAKTRDFIHVSDLVGSLIAIAERAPDGSIVNLGTSREVSLRELAAIVAKTTGRPLAMISAPGDLNDEYRMVADISRLKTLGCDPAVDLASGVASLVEHLRNET